MNNASHGTTIVVDHARNGQNYRTTICTDAPEFIDRRQNLEFRDLISRLYETMGDEILRIARVERTEIDLT